MSGIMYLVEYDNFGFCLECDFPSVKANNACDVKGVIEVTTDVPHSENITDFYAQKAAEWMLENGTEDDLEVIPPIIERFFPSFRDDLENAIAEREALRKSDEAAYAHYVR